MCHALIIEDEPLLAFHMADAAEEAGATSVDFAQSEFGAINAALQHRPDIILSDVNLDVGTGPAAVKAIRLEFGQVPVIYITATPETLNSSDHEDLVMVKPLDRECFLRHFARLAPNL